MIQLFWQDPDGVYEPVENCMQAAQEHLQNSGHQLLNGLNDDHPSKPTMQTERAKAAALLGRLERTDGPFEYTAEIDPRDQLLDTQFYTKPHQRKKGFKHYVAKGGAEEARVPVIFVSPQGLRTQHEIDDRTLIFIARARILHDPEDEKLMIERNPVLTSEFQEARRKTIEETQARAHEINEATEDRESIENQRRKASAIDDPGVVGVIPQKRGGLGNQLTETPSKPGKKDGLMAKARKFLRR